MKSPRRDPVIGSLIHIGIMQPSQISGKSKTSRKLLRFRDALFTFPKTKSPLSPHRQNRAHIFQYPCISPRRIISAKILDRAFLAQVRGKLLVDLHAISQSAPAQDKTLSARRVQQLRERAFPLRFADRRKRSMDQKFAAVIRPPAARLHLLDSLRNKARPRFLQRECFQTIRLSF